jgi:HSP20 family protein
MATITRWDPFRDLLAIQDEMNSLVGRAFGERGQGEGGPRQRAWSPVLDISESKDAYNVVVELPGISPDQIDISLEDGLLTVSGEREFTQETSEQQFHRVERNYGSFRRSITLPSQVDADGIEAGYDHGLLTVRVPKAPEAKPRRIEVRSGGHRPVEGEAHGQGEMPAGG